MNPKIDVYLGAPIENESEQQFLLALSADLKARGDDALIFANFFLPPRRPIRQIDFLVILPTIVCHVELKNLTARVLGTANGPWRLRQPDGSFLQLEASNPYVQALECKFQISDQMKVYAAARDSVWKPAGKAKFYSTIESSVCVFPSLLPGSEIPGDRRVRGFGYSDLLKFLTTARSALKWSAEDWVGFAMEIGLVRQAAIGSSTNSIATAESLLSKYASDFADFYQRELPQLVPLTVEHGGDHAKSTSLLEFVSQGRHGQLIGLSGCGKSHHVVHMALAALEAGRLPIIARPTDYGGRLSALLDRSIAHLCPQSATEFLQAAKKISRPLTLFVDGLNECPTPHKNALLKDLQAFYLRWQIPIVLTTQQEVSLPRSLAGARFQFRDLDEQQRVQILKAHVREALPDNASDICQPFRSAYELSLAAATMAGLGRNPTRLALYDAYVRRRCDGIVDAALAVRVLSVIADAMRVGLASSLPVTEVWRLCERVLDEQQAPLTTLQRVMTTGVVDVKQARCSFQHELLQRFFESVAFSRRFASAESLGAELAKPLNHGMIPFVIAMQTNETDARTCLEATAPAAARFAPLAQCLKGELGQVARRVVQGDAKKMLDDAENEVDEIEINLAQSARPDEPFVLEVTNRREWTAYEIALLDAVAMCLRDGIFLDEVLRLIARTEQRIATVLSQRLGTQSVAKRSMQSTLFWQTCLLGVTKLAAGTLTRSVDGRLPTKMEVFAVAKVRRLIARPSELTVAQLYLCLCLLDSESEAIEQELPGLVDHCWRSGIYHLQLKILQYIEFCARPWREGRHSNATRDKIKELLINFHTSNMFLNTQLVETMAAFGLIESPSTTACVASNLQEILSKKDDVNAQLAAFGAVSSMFEEIIGESYSEAIDNLCSRDRGTLFTMAALAVPSYSLDGGYILRELEKIAEPDTVRAFTRFATTLDAEALCPQQTAECFIYGHLGCARHLDAPLRLSDLTNDDRRAWQLYGELFFWSNKPGLSDEEISDRCAPIWQQLEENFGFAAIDPLMRFVDASPGMRWGMRNPVQRFVLRFRERIQAILEFGLRNREQLSAVDKRFPSQGRLRETTTFLIHTLGQIGGDDTITILEPFLEDQYHGPDVVDSIRRLNTHEPFKGLSVLRRFDEMLGD